MKYLYSGLMALIVILSFLLRTIDLSSVPPALYWDEMDAGYQAFSILKTGKDYFGNTPGLIVESFADKRAPLFIYSIIPFIALFGLEGWAVRLPAALFGTINVALVYFLCLELFKSKRIAVATAFLLAFSPWNIQYSRMAFEATLMLSLFLGGLITFLKGFSNSKWWIVSGLLFGLSVFTYNTAKLFVPVILIVLILIFIRKGNLNRNLLTGGLIFVVIFLAGLYSSFFQAGGQRFSEISVFSDPQVNTQVSFLRDESWKAYSDDGEAGLSVSLANRIFYNPLTFFADKVVRNYLGVFSTDFLLLNGDPNLRHSPAKIGELHPVEFVTLGLGIVFMVTAFRKRKKEILLLALWIALAPVPAIITREGGEHATRLFLLFPALSITSALGLTYLFSLRIHRIGRVLGTLLIAVLLFNIGFFLNHYFGAYKTESAKFFQSGFSEAVERSLIYTKPGYLTIVDDRRDSALMNYLFDNKYDPALFQPQARTLGRELYGIKAASIGDLVFLDPLHRDWKDIFKKSSIPENFVLVVSAVQFDEQTAEKAHLKFSENQRLLEVIYYPSGAPAFFIIESTAPASLRKT